MNSLPKAKPIIKWAGGKQALASTLTGYFPTTFARYFEPFLGGGSIFLALQPSSAVLSDANSWLVDTYQAVRKDWQSVAAELDSLPNSREDFLRIRSVDPLTQSLTKRAAQFIYLNKTCFRGLYRVNKKNRFNVPYGNYDRRYYDADNLASVAHTLQSAEIRTGDFTAIQEEPRRGDFVYLDPPYFKLGGYADFNRYTNNQFREQDHCRLRDFCGELDRRGVKWAVSNSKTDFVEELYADYHQTPIAARREINLNSRRRDVAELLITNYIPQAPSNTTTTVAKVS